MLPERAVIIEKVHHIKDLILDDKYIKTAAIMTISYIVLILMGSFAGMFLGYGFFESIFESASASGNVGLSMGITQPSMHWLLKLTFILQMWIGRLEFLSIFSLVGLIIAIIKGRQ
jgi:trk system potassium uptake protein TrkH